MFTKEAVEGIETAADEFGIEAAALLAIAEIESGGRAFVTLDGRSEPLIRFEGHYFDRRLPSEARAIARARGLSSPVAGAIPNPAAQAARWRLLDQAAAIDRKAAFESTSWGLGQVMGAHWAWLGYASVDAMVAEARAGAGGQARQMARYVFKAGLAEALAQRDWAAFARGYNGPAYRANAYDKKLAAAFSRHGGTVAVAATPSDDASRTLLRRGDRGFAVADLQAALSASGYPVAIDGAFGPLTADAVSRFQRDNGLAADGIAGPLTLAALREALSIRNRLKRLWKSLASFFGRGTTAPG